jgi:predicted nuclease of predicted toxin-antitoxin system
MKLLLDQGVARSAGSRLQELGHDAVHVGEIGMASATDRAILEEAAQRQAVVVTFDADFHALLALRGELGRR